MSERYTWGYIFHRLDGSKELVSEASIELGRGNERDGESIKYFGVWFDYIGIQDGDRIYQERKPQ